MTTPSIEGVGLFTGFSASLNFRFCRYDTLVLTTMTQQMIHQHKCQHGFCDGYCANADTRVLATFGDKLGWLTVHINRLARHGNAGSRLQGDISDNILPAGDAA